MKPRISRAFNPHSGGFYYMVINSPPNNWGMGCSTEQRKLWTAAVRFANTLNRKVKDEQAS